MHEVVLIGDIVQSGTNAVWLKIVARKTSLGLKRRIRHPACTCVDVVLFLQDSAARQNFIGDQNEQKTCVVVLLGEKLRPHRKIGAGQSGWLWAKKTHQTLGEGKSKQKGLFWEWENHTLFFGSFHQVGDSFLFKTRGEGRGRVHPTPTLKWSRVTVSPKASVLTCP